MLGERTGQRVRMHVDCPHAGIPLLLSRSRGCTRFLLDLRNSTLLVRDQSGSSPSLGVTGTRHFVPERAPPGSTILGWHRGSYPVRGGPMHRASPVCRNPTETFESVVAGCCGLGMDGDRSKDSSDVLTNERKHLVWPLVKLRGFHLTESL